MKMSFKSFSLLGLIGLLTVTACVKKETSPVPSTSVDTVFVPSKPDTVLVGPKTDTIVVQSKPDTVVKTVTKIDTVVKAVTNTVTKTDTLKIPSKPDTVVKTVTNTVTKTDTVKVPAPLPSGTDQLVKADTTIFTKWHTGRINDSTWRVIKPPVVPPVPPTALGKTFGPSGLIHNARTGYPPFNHDPGASSDLPQWLLSNLNAARSRKITVRVGLPCGSHNFTTLGYCMKRRADSVPVFDLALYKTRIALFDTPETRAAVQKAWTDGILTDISLIDEPWVTGTGDGSGGGVGNTWGPKGTLDRVLQDQVCTIARQTFGPGVPIGMSDDWTANYPTQAWKVCDVGMFQFSYRNVEITAWRDSALARAKRHGYMAAFSFNIINGGTQDPDARAAGGVWDCKNEGGAIGQNLPNCQMTPAQVVNAVTVLGDAGCGGLMMWNMDSTRFASVPGYAAAFKQAADIQAKRAPKPCKAR